MSTAVLPFCIGIVTLLLVVMNGLVFAASPAIVDVGVGGGYDDNLNHTESSNRKEGSPFGTGWIVLGMSKDFLTEDSLFFNLAYEGTFYSSYSDLTVNDITAEVGIFHTFSDSVFVKLAPTLGVTNYGDSDRDATVSGLSLSLRSLLSPEFVAIIGYRYTHNDASDPIFSYDANRVNVSGELELSPKTYLTLGYAIEFSENIFYQEATSSSSGTKMNKPSSTFGANQIAIKDDTKAHILFVDWDYEFNTENYIQLAYSYSHVTSDLENYNNNRISVGVGYRF